MSSLEEPREEPPTKKRKLCKDNAEEEVRSEPSKKPARSWPDNREKNPGSI